MSLLADISQQEAARELLTRRRARSSVISFARAIDIPGAPVSDDPDTWLFKPVETDVAPHHELFMSELQACIEKPYGRLIIMSPPGSAKTTYAGVVTPAWAMGRFPGLRVLYCSHSKPPAMRTARKVQLILRSAVYRGIFPDAHLVKGSEGVEEFSLSNGSAMQSAGLLAGITSTRMDLGILDDVVAGREEADSPAMSTKIRYAYDDDFLTRLKPSASIIMFMTRWAVNDIIGSILPADYDGRTGDVLCRDGQVWRVVNLPAEAERTDDPLGRKPGEMLWPQWFDERHWAIFRRNPRTWNALYQQRPAPSSAGHFVEADFNRYDVLPSKDIKFVLSSDWAVTEKDGEANDEPDKTEQIAVGYNPEGDLFFDHGLSFQEEPGKVRKEGEKDPALDGMLDLIRKYKITEQLIESGVILNSTKGMINRAMIDSAKDPKGKAYAPITKMPSSGDKVAKATALKTMVRMGKVWVKNGEWGDRFIAQCCGFPRGRFKDMVDAAGQAARYIDELFAPKTPEPVSKRKGARPFTPQDMWEAEDREKARKRIDFMG